MQDDDREIELIIKALEDIERQYDDPPTHDWMQPDGL